MSQFNTMNIAVLMKKEKSTCMNFHKVPVKLISVIFLGLIIYISINILSSSFTLTLKVDMSVKKGGNVREAFDSFVDLSSDDLLNESISLGSFPARENERMLQEQSMYFNITNSSNFVSSVISEELERAKKVELPEVPFNVTNSKLSSDLQTFVSDNSNASFANKSLIVKEINHTIEPRSLKDKFDILGNKVNESIKVRQTFCDSCFRHTFSYIIQNDKICYTTGFDESIDLLILILTSHKNSKARSALRSTWLTHSRNNTANVRYAFLLGETKDFSYKEAVKAENRIFHDIIKEDFIDTYTNLTFKTIMGFKWAATRCAHARYVMKTDDDMYVNVPNLLKLVKGRNKQNLQSKMIGICSRKARPIRYKKSKWFASKNSYPEKFYPGFCSGTGYVTSMHVVTEVFKISPSVPFFHLEDVYVSLCMRKLGFKLQSMPGFNSGRPKMSPCIYKGTKLTTAHHLTPIMLRLMWHRPCLKKAT